MSHHGAPGAEWAILCDACGRALHLPTTPEHAKGWEVHQFDRVGRNGRMKHYEIHTCGCDQTAARLARFRELERSTR